MADESPTPGMSQADRDEPGQDRLVSGPEDHVTVSGGRVPDAVGSRGHTPGPHTGGVHAGGLSAADVGGGGAGGDIDHPDITGRGGLEDIAAEPEREGKTNPGGDTGGGRKA